MKKRKILTIISLTLLSVSLTFAQKSVVKKETVSKNTIFAVLNDGKTLEPIAFIENGKLIELGKEASGEQTAAFVKTNYAPKFKYNVIFGGENVGTATVLKDLIKSECAANQAEISVVSPKVKLKGFLMALATNAAFKKNTKLVRAMPTADERTAIDKLVMSEMLAKNVPIKNTDELRYHNLTKLDVNGDGIPEFVGTYWYNTGDKIRSLLFFIAEKDKQGNITIPFTKFNEIAQKDIMQGADVKALDSGTYHELLLDMFDYDGDGQSEIFTHTEGLEGSSFDIYKRIDGKWTQVLETSNYHCGF